MRARAAALERARVRSVSYERDDDDDDDDDVAGNATAAGRRGGAGSVDDKRMGAASARVGRRA